VRLYNWNIIKTALQQFQIVIGEDEMNLITAGDQQMILELIQSIREAGQNMGLNQQELNQEPETEPKSNVHSKALHYFMNNYRTTIFRFT
jgi:hypothetical protein